MRPKRFKRNIPKLQFKTNQYIRSQEVRLVGENVEPGVYSLDKALELARQQELDLVEVSPNAVPPVCRIIDYNKFLYQKKKKEKEIKSKSIKVVIKEIRFTPNTDDHDYKFKLKHAEKFLNEGFKVKAFVQFRGRNIIFKERGELLLLRLAEELNDIATIEQLPKLEGRRMFILIIPKTDKKK